MKNPFRRGDRALHKSNQLDSRPVAKVEGNKIYLQINTLVTDPVPASNYIRVATPSYRVISDGHSNHNLPIGTEVKFLGHDYDNDVDLFTQGGVGDEVAIDPRDLEQM